MVESRVGKSLSCQATVVCNAREPLRMMEMPSGPWKKGRVDFAGPFPIKEMALVFWDQYARYPVVEFVTTTSADSVIPLFTRVFNRHVIPEEIESDNGPPFDGSKFSNLHGNRDWDIERSFLPGLRNVLFKRWRRAQKSLDSDKTDPKQAFGLEESYIGIYPKGWFIKREFRVTRLVRGTRQRKSRWKLTWTKEKCPGMLD